MADSPFSFSYLPHILHTPREMVPIRMSLRGISKRDGLLITCKGTIGEMVIQGIEEAHIARQIFFFSLFNSSYEHR